MNRALIKVTIWGLCLFFFGTISLWAAPIRIGISLSLTGKYAPMAKMQERAYRLWETHTNTNGGILGRTVDVIIYDDGSDKEAAQKIYRNMIEKEQLEFLFAPYSSSITMAVLPITEKYGYPLLTPGAASDSIWKQGYRYVFGVYLPASRYSLGFLELMRTRNFDKLAVISADDSFSQNAARGVKKWSERLGMQIVLHRTISKGAQQLEPEARAVKESGAHALLMCGHFNEAVQMRRALKDIDWYPRVYWATVGPVLEAYYDQLGALANNSFSSTQWKYYEKLPFPGSKQFYNTFTDTFHVEPSYHAAASYATGLILHTAIKKAGNTDRAKVRDILGALDITTLLGRYGVDRTGMQIRQFALIIQWIDGRQEIVWPPELRTTEPRFP